MSINSGEQVRTGDLSMVNLFTSRPTHKEDLFPVGKYYPNFLSQILIWEMFWILQPYLFSYFQIKQLEDQKCLLLNLFFCGNYLFCLLISKDNLEKIYYDACLPLIIANNKMETELPGTQETKQILTDSGIIRLNTMQTLIMLCLKG